MKYLIIYVMVAAICTNSVSGQTQALQQLELDIEKLAQMKAMLSSMYNGYTILANGYNNLKDQSFANFNLHKTLIDGLSSISPAVKNASAITDIINAQASIVAEYKTAIATIKAAGVFNATELINLGDAYATVLVKTSDNLETLQQVITPNTLQMSEAERLDFLSALGRDMEKQLAAVRTFTAQANQVAQLRLRLKKDNETLRSVFSLNK